VGHHEVSDPLRNRRPAASDRVVATQRLLDRAPLGIGKPNVDSVLTRMRCLRSSACRHRFFDITISENRSTSNSVSTTSAGSRFR
jgi:hypothetical protein